MLIEQKKWEMTMREKQLCFDQKIDAIFAHQQYTYVFIGDNYYAIDENDKISNEFPRPISEGWPGLPGYLDITSLFK